MDDESISSSDRTEYWFQRIKFFSALFCLSEAIGLGDTWDLPEEVERLGCTNPSTSTWNPSTLTSVGEPLRGEVLEAPAEPFVAVSEGPVEPIVAVLGGSAESLEAVL